MGTTVWVPERGACRNAAECNLALHQCYLEFMAILASLIPILSPLITTSVHYHKERITLHTLDEDASTLEKNLMLSWIFKVPQISLSMVQQSNIECNPNLTFLGIRPIDYTNTQAYVWVNRDRIALIATLLETFREHKSTLHICYIIMEYSSTKFHPCPRQQKWTDYLIRYTIAPGGNVKISSSNYMPCCDTIILRYNNLDQFSGAVWKKPQIISAWGKSNAA